jgi:beta-RFAP synthase
VADALCRLVLLEILPAVIERDLPAFGAALSELQARVGACFAPAQGGIYSAPRADSITQEMRALGFIGVGQSSWGPTLYGFAPSSHEESIGQAELLRRRLGLTDSAVLITKAANCGAKISAAP